MAFASVAAFTTRQRDILRILLEASAPLGAAEIATRLSITTRQVTYSLVGVKSWLAQRDIPLKVTPGVGVSLECSSEQSQTLQREVASKTRLQLILTPGQRQQQLALLLLSRSRDPLLVQYLQHLLQIARATVLKDLDESFPQDERLAPAIQAGLEFLLDTLDSLQAQIERV